MYENKNCLLEIDLLEPWLPGSYYVPVEFR